MLGSSVLLHSKTFDPKLFLSTIHPNATFKDLNRGRTQLKENLEQRSGALKLLVEAEWDRFVGVKGTTESTLVSLLSLSLSFEISRKKEIQLMK